MCVFVALGIQYAVRMRHIMGQVYLRVLWYSPVIIIEGQFVISVGAAFPPPQNFSENLNYIYIYMCVCVCVCVCVCGVSV